MLKYVELNNGIDKKPTHKFEYAKATHENMKNAALLVPDGIVVVDFDGDNIDKNGKIYDEDIIFYLLNKYRPYWTKSRPNHFQLYFKIPDNLKMKAGADILTVGGFQVDYRVNKNSLAIIKTDGKLRECACELTEEVLDNLPLLPTLCYPMYKNNDHTTFVGLVEGDGRDDLMLHHTIFARKRYRTIDLKETMYYINHHLFKEPLDDKIIDSQIARAPMYVDKSDEEIKKLSYEYRETKLIKFSDIKTEEPKWIWYPYIPLGTLVLLVGDPGVGKSYFALYVSSIISNGGEFPFTNAELNEIKIPSKVLFQNGEDGVSYTISLRLDKLKANKENIFMIDESVDIFRVDQVEVLEEIVKNNDIKLIVIDPIQRYLPEKNSMNSANEVRNALSPLKDLAEKYKCTIIFIIHKNKSTKNQDLYRALGSIDFVGICRSMLTMDNRTIKQTKNSLSAKGKTLLYKISEDGLEITSNASSVDEENDLSKLEQAEKFIEEELQKGPMTSIDVYFKAFVEGISMSTLKRAKKHLKVNGVQLDKQWYWSLEKDITLEEANKRYKKD